MQIDIHTHDLLNYIHCETIQKNRINV